MNLEPQMKEKISELEKKCAALGLPSLEPTKHVGLRFQIDKTTFGTIQAEYTSDVDFCFDLHIMSEKSPALSAFNDYLIRKGYSSGFATKIPKERSDELVKLITILRDATTAHTQHAQESENTYAALFGRITARFD